MSFQMLIWIKLFVCVLFMIWVNALQETFLPLIKKQVHEDIEEKFTI